VWSFHTESYGYSTTGATVEVSGKVYTVKLNIIKKEVRYSLDRPGSSRNKTPMT
jgi:hypothetical protein